MNKKCNLPSVWNQSKTNIYPIFLLKIFMHIQLIFNSINLQVDQYVTRSGFLGVRSFLSYTLSIR